VTKIVILAGEGEYESDRTMRTVADDFERELGATVIYRTPDLLRDFHDFPPSSFGDLSDLEDADLLVIYTRFRYLPDSEMDHIVRFCERGGNVIGLRTSTHAFHYPEDSQWFEWNDGFGRDVLGSPWVSHHGHTSTTRVEWYSPAGHPVLDGVPQVFTSSSWLYRVALADDCVPVLWGTPIDPESPPTPSPFAWVRERGRQRIVYTNTGQQGDFDQMPLHRFLVNAARWCVESRDASAI
jgi:type 1 glutamine amidotransferase